MAERSQQQPPRPSDTLRELSEEQLVTLHRIGEQWSRAMEGRADARRDLPVDPDVGSYPARHEISQPRYERFVDVSALGGSPGVEQATESADLPTTRAGRARYHLRRVVLGPALRSTALVRERMRKLVALPVLASDALSSVAYGPEAMLAVLVLGGAAALAFSVPIAAAIVLLMVTVGISYRQTIRAYPNGGGAYIVASDQLGRVPGLFAAGGLVTDYILTVSVSASAGIAAITSAFPALSGATVPMGVAAIVILLAANLRGVRQAGILFAAPTYVFVFSVLAVIVVGLVKGVLHGFPPPTQAQVNATTGVTVFLILRAFTSGATALTGVEAVTNAVPAFRPVEWRNARTSLTWVIATLVTLFVGIITLVLLTGTLPSHNETVLSQLARHSFGTGAMYALVQASTAVILLMAANTAYNDFPRVLYLLARDHHAPRAFMRLGDRLAYSNGIIVLTVAASLIYVAFGGVTTALIPVYAVGVFLSFSLSQGGMTMHWWRSRGPRWRRSMALNGAGALMCTLVFVTAAITKFTAGAWVALLTVGGFVFLALRIRAHYDTVEEALRLRTHTAVLPTVTAPVPAFAPVRTGAAERARRSDVEPGGNAEAEESPEEIHHLVVVPVETLDLANVRALAYAASLHQPVFAVHISPSDEDAEKIRGYWNRWGDHLPLEIVVSPYRTLIAPLVNYIEALHEQRPGLMITVVLPEVVPERLRHRILHDRVAVRLRRALQDRPESVITTVPFHVGAALRAAADDGTHGLTGSDRPEEAR